MLKEKSPIKIENKKKKSKENNVERKKIDANLQERKQS